MADNFRHAHPRTPRPTSRKLRLFSFDPSLRSNLSTATINSVTVSIPWETLEPGPVGEYLEVVDVDPASGLCYPPVWLDDPVLLAQDGLAPSESNPQFHQQMAYAVAMLTIRSFERALGRKALWSPHRGRDSDNKYYEEYVGRLRIYPHAIRQANAYYHPAKKALLFGYFAATSRGPEHVVPGSLVFTALSFDIIAHETAHALLDGLHRRYTDASNPDVLSFHEAFADVVALFQHFSFPEVLEHQLRRTRGDLSSENLLAQLAHQFGQAQGGHGALRDALGRIDEDGVWYPAPADSRAFENTREPHARGAIAVAAVFEAFVKIYRERTSDLFRIASGGTGILPQGELHPDLVNRLAREAAKAASHILTMCIRALDFCPPVDVTFGDFLRAVITADLDLYPDDQRGYRVAFIEAFRRRGIYPPGLRTLSEESLCWPTPDNPIYGQFFERKTGELRAALEDWNLRSDRSALYQSITSHQAAFHGTFSTWLSGKDREEAQNFMRAIGLEFGSKVEVHSLRPARRTEQNGEVRLDLILELTQRRPLVHGQPHNLDGPWFRGGSTLVIDMDTGKVRFVVTKDILDEKRRATQASNAALIGHSDYGAERLSEASLFALVHQEVQ